MENIEIKQLESSEVEVSGELPAPEFAKFRVPAVHNLNQRTTIDGFRQGNAPEAVLLKHVGEEKLLMEMAELALQELYPKIVEEKKIDAIGRPEITITKLAPENPLGFKIKTAIAPEVKLPDYKKLAKAENEKPAETVVVEDKDVDQVLEELRRNRAQTAEPTKPDSPAPTLPELDDDFAKSVGQFQTLEELKSRIKENLTKEKEYKLKDKKRLAIMEAIIAESTIILPPVLIEGEIDRMLVELKADIERVGLKFEDYLKHLKKTEEELRGAWRTDAEKRLKTGLILDKLKVEEKLAPKPEAVEAETKHLSSHYPTVPPEKIALHVQSLLANEEVWKFLEGQK